MSRLDGATIIARSLKQQGVEHVFGILGFPVVELAHTFQREGLNYYGFRNEQSASYAAGAVGYMTGRPGVCMTVSGPGMVHAIAGLSNAWANCWPMVLLSGAPDSYQREAGAFQEAPQLEAARPFVKLSTRPDSIARLPTYVEKCIRTAMHGRPGAVYLDLPSDLISGAIEEESVHYPRRVPPATKTLADPAQVLAALAVLRSAQRPLVVVGKGAAYAHAEHEVRHFLEATKLPFLAAPMAKGLVPDDHPQSVAPARSVALAEADLVFLIGARLNWIMHFGLPPRFAPDVRVIQLDIAAEEIGTNVPAEAALVGDAQAVMGQLNTALTATPWHYPEGGAWWDALRAKAAENDAQVSAMSQDDSVPMGYYHVLKQIRDVMPRDAIVCSEGANTMDIGRTMLPNYLPRLRLDAGSFGTMGVGPGFAIAAAVTHPGKRVFCIEGDSAFGFSGLEVETACRYRLPIIFMVFNNNGIGSGEVELANPVPPHVFTPESRYERIIEAFGGFGLCVSTPNELETALKAALAETRMPTLINVLMNPQTQRKPQKFEWLTR